MGYPLNANRVPPWAETVQSRPSPIVPSWSPVRPSGAVEIPLAVRRWGKRFSSAYAGPTYPDADLLNTMDLNDPWKNMLEPQYTEKQIAARRMARFKQWALSVLQTNPFLPFTMRGLVFVFSVVGLGIACKIYVNTRSHTGYLSQQASTIMAISVLSVALVYLVYNMYDEFFGKPLGLRRAVSKLKFIIVDLIFICFGAANLALAFHTVYDSQWVCHLDYDARLCHRQRDLVGLIFISLILQMVAFGVSVFRMIDRAV